MEEGTPLSELLNDEPSNESEIEQEVPAEPVAEEPARDEQGRFAPKGETESASPAPVVTEPELDHKAIVGERRRRQEAEERARTLEAQLQSLQNPPAPPPSVWEDEQAYGGHIVSTAVQQATFNAKLDMSEMMVRQAQPDFDDMKAKFLELAGMNPSLREQALADPHPWNKAYTIAKNAAKMEALGAVDVADMEAKIREQIMAEQAHQPARQALPPTLSTERSVAARTGPAWSGPVPLSDLLR